MNNCSSQSILWFQQNDEMVQVFNQRNLCAKIWYFRWTLVHIQCRKSFAVENNVLAEFWFKTVRFHNMHFFLLKVLGNQRSNAGNSSKHKQSFIPATTRMITARQELPTSSPRCICTAFSLIEAKLKNDKNYNFKSSSTLSSNTIADVHNEIFHLSAIVGGLSTLFHSEPHNLSKHKVLSATSISFPTSSEQLKVVHYEHGRVFLQLFVIARVCDIDLRMSILKKVELNGRKYPVELCKVRTLDYCQRLIGGEYQLIWRTLTQTHNILSLINYHSRERR